ncbi:unnamed protein product [Pieris brassicae]|uniref:Uncharacterized protein n=1 Tax=Pieris brassicae TaxID=7116 RepID=A0A9P0U1R1_PIEBR|nr:unnamed protein product [Pieris brassicae]
MRVLQRGQGLRSRQQLWRGRRAQGLGGRRERILHYIQSFRRASRTRVAQALTSRAGAATSEARVASREPLRRAPPRPTAPPVYHPTVAPAPASAHLAVRTQGKLEITRYSHFY